MHETKATWLHISDFHFKAGDPYDRDVVLKAFLRSLPDLITRSGSPEFVVASGDIAYSGQASEYEAATLFFDKILTQLNLDRSKLIIVPGNHDIDRKSGRGIIRTLTADEADNYFDPSENFIHITTRMAAFTKWYDTFFAGIRTFSTNSTCLPVIDLDCARGSVQIMPVNSSVFAFDENDHGKLWLGRRSLSDALELNKFEDSKLKLAVMHHPLNWLASAESSNIKSMLRERFDCILTGHLHETDIEQVAGLYGGSIHLSAGALYQTRDWPNTAMMVSWTRDKLVVTPFRYEDSPVEIWTIDPSVFAKNPDFKGHFNLERFREKAIDPDSSPEDYKISDSTVSRPPTDSLTSRQAQVDFERDLFLAPSGKALFATPRIMAQPHENAENGSEVDEITISTITSSTLSYIIESRSEYGGSTLCKILANGFLTDTSKKVFRKDARELPSYRKKLESEFSSIDAKNFNVLILDNFDVERHERLLRELRSTGWFNQYIAIVQNSGPRPIGEVDVSSVGIDFMRAYLWPMSRAGIRTMAAELFQSGDEQFVSGIVDKVYSDLLALCIPLTPSNVIMYLRILYREGEFHPVNRVDIVGRYIGELLRKPSDIYAESFTGRNKADFISSFTYQMYLDKISHFDRRYWNEFATRYQKETLTDFDSRVLLEESLDARIFIEIGSRLYHKYSFFYSYFLGRYISNRTDALNDFIKEEEYLRLRGVVDVVSGLSSDNNSLVKALTEKLASRLHEFAEKYIPSNFDPLEGALWPTSSDEEERLWKPIAAQIDAGPRSTSEIDAVKTSLLSEQRTAMQEVSLAKYSELESALFECALILIDALRNADDVSGELKIRALDVVLRARLVVFQVGALCAPMLASRKLFRWGGVAYLDFNIANVEPDSPQAKLAIIDSLSYSIAKRLAELLGTKKLAGLFRASASKIEKIGYIDILLFHLVVSARGLGWEDTAREMIKKAPRDSFFLSMMCDSLTDLSHHEILQVKDRSSVKQLISLISAKRVYRKELPGAKAVNRRLRSLEKKGSFENSTESEQNEAEGAA